MSKHRITGIKPGSIAEELNMKSGDFVLEINGQPIEDVFDYEFLCRDEYLELLSETAEGEQILFEIEKEEDEDLGLLFDGGLMDQYRSCRNKCIFCFIDQMPPGMRETLYVKDDDWRLSLMMGNYITMTNMTDAEFERVIRRHVSPLYISVHATDPDVRTRMLHNPRAGRLTERLRMLKEAGIRFHCQIVLCPGWNDGEVLDRTLRDLGELWPAACSAALVPVGLTKFREGLEPLTGYDSRSAADLLDRVEPFREAFLRDHGTRFAFPSDEFYCLSGRDLPPDEAYEDYPQIENGVGMLRMFETELMVAAEDEPVASTPPRHLVIACGTSVAQTMRRWCDTLAPEGTTVEVLPIRNRFFGESITVSGLLTAGDLIDQAGRVEADAVLITRSMLRADGDLFLDDMNLTQVQEKFRSPLRVVENTGTGLWRAISGLEGW